MVMESQIIVCLEVQSWVLLNISIVPILYLLFDSITNIIKELSKAYNYV